MLWRTLHIPFNGTLRALIFFLPPYPLVKKQGKKVNGNIFMCFILMCRSGYALFKMQHVLLELMLSPSELPGCPSHSQVSGLCYLVTHWLLTPGVKKMSVGRSQSLCFPVSRNYFYPLLSPSQNSLKIKC